MSDQNKKEQQNIMNVYALFVVTVVLSVVPQIWAAALGAVFFTVLLILAYFFRARCEEHSLQHNHMVYIIRSVWISTFMALVTGSVAMSYVFTSVDFMVVQSCISSLTGQGALYDMVQDSAKLYALVEPCFKAFIEDNFTVLISGVLIAAGPVLGYSAYRLSKGMHRALKGYRLAKPRAWL